MIDAKIIPLKLTRYGWNVYESIPMSIAVPQKAREPSMDLPFSCGLPIFLPTRAADVSEMISTRKDAIAMPLLKNMQDTKNPRNI